VAKAVLFDMDGVLVDSYEAWFHLLVAATGQLGGRVDRQSFAAAWGQGIEADIQTFFAGRTYDEVLGFYLEHYAEHAHHVKVEPTAGRVLEALSRRGVRTAVISNTPQGLVEITLRAAGLAPGLMVGARPGAASKPAPDLVLLACAALAIAPAEALMVGDSRFDREAAAAASVPFVGLNLEAERRIARLDEVLGLV
jgi:phosphoglycolate phosphatase/AHBA synthesis associated protein